MPSRSETSAGELSVRDLAIDRIACTGHGICAGLLPEEIELDEWGYPVVRAAVLDPSLGDVAIRLCPARALRWRG